MVELNNPVCGDEIKLCLKVENDTVNDVRFSGRGCSISQSSASMMTEAVKGKPLSEALDMVERFKAMMRSEISADEADLGDLEALQGVSKFPVRIKCALLSWEALRQGLESERRTCPATSSRGAKGSLARHDSTSRRSLECRMSGGPCAARR